MEAAEQPLAVIDEAARRLCPHLDFAESSVDPYQPLLLLKDLPEIDPRTGIGQWKTKLRRIIIRFGHSFSVANCYEPDELRRTHPCVEAQMPVDGAIFLAGFSGDRLAEVTP